MELKSSWLVNGMEYLLKVVSMQTCLVLVIADMFHPEVLLELVVRMRELEPSPRTV